MIPLNFFGLRMRTVEKGADFQRMSLENQNVSLREEDGSDHAVPLQKHINNEAKIVFRGAVPELAGD